MPVDSELDVKLDHAACFRQSSELLFVDDVGEFVHVHGAGRGRRTARRG